MPIPDIDTDYLLKVLSDLLNIPSPTGYCQRAIDYSNGALRQFPDLEVRQNRKGALIANWPGERDGAPLRGLENRRLHTLPYPLIGWSDHIKLCLVPRWM